MFDYLAVKLFYRPSDYIEERMNYFKYAFILGFGVGVFLGMTLWFVPNMVSIVIIITLILSLIFIKPKKHLYAKWWRGEIPRWKIWVIW